VSLALQLFNRVLVIDFAEARQRAARSQLGYLLRRQLSDSGP